MPKGSGDNADPWDRIATYYEFIEGAQMSNSFILLKALAENEDKEMSTFEISQYISKASRGQIFKISSTLKESLENRLRKAGYVTGIDVPSEKSSKKPIRLTRYKITPKGHKLLSAWMGFIDTFGS